MTNLLPPRKPLGASLSRPDTPQSKEPYVLRLEPRDIERIKVLADSRGLGHSTVARMLLLSAIRFAEIEDASESTEVQRPVTRRMATAYTGR